MRRRYSRDPWRSWLEEQATSGLSISAFCLVWLLERGHSCHPLQPAVSTMRSILLYVHDIFWCIPGGFPFHRFPPKSRREARLAFRAFR